MNKLQLSVLLVLVLLSSVAVARWAWIEDDSEEHQTLQAKDVIIEDPQAWSKMKAACKDGAAPGEVVTVGALKCPSGNIEMSYFRCYSKNNGQSVRPLAFFCSRCPAGSGPLFTNNDYPSSCVKKAACDNGMIPVYAQDGLCTPGDVCPVGATYKVINGVEKCIGAIQCDSGFTFNRNTVKCDRIPDCESGFFYNSQLKICETIPNCPTGSVWVSTRRACVQKNPIVCPSGSELDNVVGACVSKTPIQCRPGLTLNSEALTCTANTTQCPEGTTKTAAGACIKSISCEPGFKMVSGQNICQAPPSFLKLDMTLQ